MPKKLAVFCDGTWNDLRTGHLTNVARLAKCVADIDPATGMQQIVFYDEGVGVASNISRTVDWLVERIGGAFGSGLDRKVEAAYRFLVLNYEPEDEIFVFGFSRGAYTARSLCGLIRKCGIVRRDCFDQVPKALEIYRDERHPRDPSVIEFRQNYSHARSAGIEDNDWVEPAARASEGGVREFSRENQRAHLHQHRKWFSYRMMFLGVWDTVGSLGIPEKYKLLRWLNKKYEFHDTRLSGLIASARHAVAIEENRNVFDVSRMENIDELNIEWAKKNKERGFDWDVTLPSAPNFVPYYLRPYQEVWFPGGHGAVGGGNAEIGLSSATLLWIAEGAREAGLAFRSDVRNELWNAVRNVNPMAIWNIDKKGRPKKPGAFDFLGSAGGYAARKGPARIDQVGMTARLRWCADPNWRPSNLGVMKLFKCPPKALAPAPDDYPPPPSGLPPEPDCYPSDEAPSGNEAEFKPQTSRELPTVNVVLK